MLFQLETKNVETGVVYKSPLYGSFEKARDEARAVSMAGRRTVRVVQVPMPVYEPEFTPCVCGLDIKGCPCWDEHPEMIGE
jgi:hypothetical protein